MICVHPNLATNPFSLKSIEHEFGLRAMLGDKYLRLVPTQTTKRITTCTRYALASCTFCKRTTNTQPHGADCEKCNRGVMVALGGGDNGGKAA